MLTMTDDKLIDVMRAFVTASNRLQHVSNQGGTDLRLLESVTVDLRRASQALHEALVQRGWRRPGT